MVRRIALGGQSEDSGLGERADGKNCRFDAGASTCNLASPNAPLGISHSIAKLIYEKKYVFNLLILLD